MANIGGPKTSRRRLLMSVMHSILLYGAEVWADALKIEKYRKRMAGVQRRGAQRVACAYRTVSEPATLVIAGVIPIDLLAAERKAVFLRKAERRKFVAKQEARAQTMHEWQTRCSGETRGKVEKPDCVYCGNDRDDAFHTFFECSKWIEERQKLQSEVGCLTPETIIDMMLSSEVHWEVIASYVETVLRQKKVDETKLEARETAR
ncbi:uncharacterized protein LOC117173664 [Belonocnema kinseyi]|uniref:uncharacterized protein LOC117173664 n=1 Tax=Belonocnema kinseyi TaxID=2817044 RepID=UPI00143DC971|nr:uncharacterized protein LOC117173664 [Belonocnema kinseyi]